MDLAVDGWFDHHTGDVRRLRAAQQLSGDHPSPFRERSFVPGLAIVGALFAALSGLQLAFNLLLQFDQYGTAPHTSLTLLPWTFGSAVTVAPADAVLTHKLGRGIAVIGLLALW